MTRGKWLLGGVLVLLLVGWLLTGVTEVRPGEVAVVRRFGRVLAARPTAGLWIGLPYPIDRVDKVPIEQVRRVTVGYRPDEEAFREDTPPGQLLTGDHNLVNVQVIINYSVNPEAVVEYVVQRERAEGLIARAGEAALAEWVGARDVDDVLLKGKTLLPVDLLADLGARLADYRLGVRLQSVDVAHLEPPKDVQYAFARVAEAAAEQRTMVLRAQEEAQREEAEAAADVRRLEEQTRAYVANRTRLAEAEAVAFAERLAAYRDNPLVLQAGRWQHLLKLVTKLHESGQLIPLDPDIKMSLPGQK